MAMTDVAAVGFFAREGLALPATQLIEDGWPTSPVRVFSAMREQCRDLGPALIAQICIDVKKSIQYGLDHREEGMAYAIQFS